MTNSTPTRLLFRKKSRAIYADGSSKMNLGIATAVRMLKGATNVPVEVAADAAARKLAGWGRSGNKTGFQPRVSSPRRRTEGGFFK